MSTQPTKQWGQTPAISTAFPTPTDIAQNAAMIEELKRQNNYEAASETQKRQSTLQLLQNITVEFVKDVSRKRGYPESQVTQFGGRIYPYGSYRLGVFGPGSDIDTLVVAPRHVKRQDFFDVYPTVLRKMAPDSVGSLTAVPDSFVPIIKLVFNDIDIDLIFVSIASLHTIPLTLDLKDDKLLDALDQPGIRAITGPRVTDEILAAVPQPKTFRTALRAIKLWAQRRAIYANILGFPGGVAWAILVARVCQLYPHATGATIAAKFFWVVTQWSWPTPVTLKAVDVGTGKEKVWNPSIYPGDRKNIMPIITPAYPNMNTTYNISKSGKAIILKEVERGMDIAQKIFENKLQWKDLFQRHTFFTTDHKFYLSVVASSNNKEAKKSWAGLVESKVRILVMKLEEQADMIELARPFTKGYERVHKSNSPAQAVEIKKGSVKYQVEDTQITESTAPQLAVENAQNGSIIPEVKDAKPEQHAPDEPETIYTTTFYVGIDLAPQAPRNPNISASIIHFHNVCTSWANFREDLQGLGVVMCTRYELPDDVFDKDKGDVKPTKAKKKTVLNGTRSVSKRSIDEVECPATNGIAKRQAS